MTAYFCKPAITPLRRHDIERAICSLRSDVLGTNERVSVLLGEFEEKIKIIIPEVKLGTFTPGYQFLWESHNFKLYNPNLSSIKKFLVGKVIYDDCGNSFSTRDFFRNEIGNYLYKRDNLLDGTENENSAPHFFISSDGLRFLCKKLKNKI